MKQAFNRAASGIGRFINVRTMAAFALGAGLFNVGSDVMRLNDTQFFASDTQAIQTYLDEQNLSPEIAQRLSGDSIMRFRRDEDVNSQAQPFHFPFISACMINVHPHAPWLNDNLFAMVPVVERLDRVPEGELVEQFVFFHEMRHCSPENHLSDYMVEADADYEAAMMMNEVNGRDDFVRYIMYWRVLYDILYASDEDNHATALYLDAKLRGIEPPSEEELRTGSQQAKDLVGRMFYVQTPAQQKAIIEGLIAQESTLPATRRTLELYLEAQRYFMPSIDNLHFPQDAKPESHAVPAVPMV